MKRECPICHNEIPASAHRLKKLCGKKECLLEQQRISSRKSYHKVLGHTEPEKRSCVVCHNDISHLRGNRVVCEKPECKKEIKRRSGYAYFERNSGNIIVKERNRVNAQKYRAAKRKCRICRDDISHLPEGQDLCEKQSCADYLARIRGQKGTSANTPRASTPRVKKPAAPKLDTRYQRVPKASQKPTIVRRQPVKHVESSKPWVPMKPMNLPEFTPQYGGMKAKDESDFADPWNCQACRDNNCLCRLHQRMDDDGDRPPLTRITSIMSTNIRRIS